MNDSALPEVLWSELAGRLWHATSPTGLHGILAEGAIRISGNLYPNSLCRHLGGVSLMDFGAIAEHLEGQADNWRDWFGHQQQCRVPVWLEIDRNAVLANLTDAGQARTIWRGNLNKLMIPGIEACHRGPLPISAITSVLLIDRHHLSTFQCYPAPWQCLREAIKAFETSLPPPAPQLLPPSNAR